MGDKISLKVIYTLYIGEKMQVAKAFMYKETPITIIIDKITNMSTVITNKINLSSCTDIFLLEKQAKALVDQEIDGNIHNNSFKFRNNVSS